MYNSKIKKIEKYIEKRARLDNEWHMIRGNIVYIESGKVIKRLSKGFHQIESTLPI